MIVLGLDLCVFKKREKWSGIGCRKNLENTQMVSTVWQHEGWPPSAHVVAETLQAEVLCTEEGFRSIGLELISGNFRDVWEG